MTTAELAKLLLVRSTYSREVGRGGKGHETTTAHTAAVQPMCVVNTCVTCYVLLCGTARVPRCVHPFRVCAVLCNTVLVSAALLLGVISFFLRSGDVECMTAAELANSTP